MTTDTQLAPPAPVAPAQQAQEPVAQTLASHAAGEAGDCLFSRFVPSGTPLYAAPQPVEQEPLTADEQDGLYWRLHSLSKSLEGRGRIDEYDTPDAYRTILDAMNALRDKKGGQHVDAKP